MSDTLLWPPMFVDESGDEHNWGDTVPPDEAEVDDGSPPLTYRELAHEIADQYGGIEDFLAHQWLRQGEQPEPEPERSTCPECGVALHPDLGVECDACGWMA